MVSLAMAARSPFRISMTVVNGATVGERGLRLHQRPAPRASTYITCEYIGCSTQSVPSWSKVAMRSARGTNFGLPWSWCRSTNSTIAGLAAPSFQDGSVVGLRQ